MQNQLDQKRQFLRQQILQGGYDQEDFVDFLKLSSTSNQGDIDINIWSFQQLKNLVQQYKALNATLNKKKSSSDNSKKPKIKAIVSKNQTQKIEQEEQSQMQQTGPAINLKEKQSQSQILQREQDNQVPIKKVQLLDEQDVQSTVFHTFDKNKHQIYSQTIPCMVAPPNSLLTANISIQILKFEKKEGGVFQKSYVVYFISTPFLKKVVERRYSDFQWLKQTLEALHPGIPVPPIAKKGQFRRYDDKHLNKRMMILEMFLNKILQIPELRANQIFQNFLKFDDFVLFQKFKSDYRKLQNLPFSKIKNMKGKLTLAIEPKINRFLRKAQQHLNESQLDVKKIFKQFKAAATMLEGAMGHLNTISQTCNISDIRDKKFRADTQTKYFSTNMFTVIQQMAQKYAETLKKQADTFRKQVYSTIKYEYLHQINYLDALDKLAVIQNNYKEGKMQLEKKKERLYQQGNIAKWGNPELTSKDKFSKKETLARMLPKQNGEVQKLRESYALHNFYLFQEVQRYFERNNMHIAVNLQKLARQHSKINGQSMMLWVDFLTKLSAMKQGKSINNSDLIMT